MKTFGGCKEIKIKSKHHIDHLKTKFVLCLKMSQKHHLVILADYSEKGISENRG